MSDLIVYTARKIHTMEPSQPVGQAIAVRDGTILEVGTLESLSPWLERFPHVEMVGPAGLEPATKPL